MLFKNSLPCCEYVCVPTQVSQSLHNTRTQRDGTENKHATPARELLQNVTAKGRERERERHRHEDV